MARKSRKNTPIAVAEPTDNLTTKAVLSLDKEAKPYQVGIYARLSFESEANKERDTVDTQIAYIREFINGQDDMVEVCVYADISVTGTTFERPEFDRMIHDIRAGKINTVITRDLSRLGRNYVEAGNYIERVFPFLDVRYIAITDDFDTARPGTDLSVPFKNIVNEYYSKDLSKKVETGKHSIWAQGGFSEGTPPYGYYRATDGSRKLLIDEEVSDNVVRIFNMFLDGKGYAGIARQSPIIIAVTNKELRDRLSAENAKIMGTATDPFYGAPVILIVLADKDIPTYQYDGSLVMGNLMNAAESLGLGSIWIHRAKEEFESDFGKKILAELGIEGNYEGIGHCAIGYAAAPANAPAPRKENYVYYVK